MRIKCGDVVLHRPTKEKWVVAYADYDSGRLSWFGWPEGSAQISDCDLLEQASDEKHREHVAMWLDGKHERDHRAETVRRLYGGLP